jgi:hypothetical protein
MRRPRPHDLATEIVRRATGPDGTKSHVARLSEPPTPGERLQLIAAHLERRPIVILPHKRKRAAKQLAGYAIPRLDASHAGYSMFPHF